MRRWALPPSYPNKTDIGKPDQRLDSATFYTTKNTRAMLIFRQLARDNVIYDLFYIIRIQGEY